MTVPSASTRRAVSGVSVQERGRASSGLARKSGDRARGGARLASQASRHMDGAGP